MTQPPWNYLGSLGAFIELGLHGDDPYYADLNSGIRDEKPSSASIKNEALGLELTDPDHYWLVCKDIDPYNEDSLYLFLPKSKTYYNFPKRLLENGTEEQVRDHKIYPTRGKPVIDIINKLETACNALYPVAFNGYDIQRLFSDSPNPYCNDQQQKHIKTLVHTLVANNDRRFDADPVLKMRRGIRSLIYKE